MIVKTKLWGKNTNGGNASVTVGRPGGPESGLRSNCPGQGTTRSAWHASNTAAKRGTLVTTFRGLWVVLSIHYCPAENKSDLEKGEETGVSGGKSICRTRMDVT